MAKPPEDDSFLSRWSKRKRVSGGAPERADANPPAPDTQPDAVPDSSEVLGAAELAALPSIDLFTIDTDIRPFLQKRVPLAMRNAALRKKWLLTPAIRDHADPAVDYAWDWNTPGGVPGDGVAPSAQRAAEMLRDLTQPNRDAAADGPAENDAESTAQPSPSCAENAPQHIPAGQSQGMEAVPQDTGARRSGEADINQENQSDIAETPVRRRHGSALPD